jgi:hypothetical protein
VFLPIDGNYPVLDVGALKTVEGSASALYKRRAKRDGPGLSALPRCHEVVAGFPASIGGSRHS